MTKYLQYLHLIWAIPFLILFSFWLFFTKPEKVAAHLLKDLRSGRQDGYIFYYVTLFFAIYGAYELFFS